MFATIAGWLLWPLFDCGGAGGVRRLMKVTRNYLNRVCRIEWSDPVSENNRVAVAAAAKGKAALAKWVEYGVIDDITDGVVRFRHSESYDPGEIEVHEALFGWVQEELIDKVDILDVVKPE